MEQHFEDSFPVSSAFLCPLQNTSFLLYIPHGNDPGLILLFQFFHWIVIRLANDVLSSLGMDTIVCSINDITASLFVRCLGLIINDQLPGKPIVEMFIHVMESYLHQILDFIGYNKSDLNIQYPTVLVYGTYN